MAARRRLRHVSFVEWCGTAAVVLHILTERGREAHADLVMSAASVARDTPGVLGAALSLPPGAERDAKALEAAAALENMAHALFAACGRQHKEVLGEVRRVLDETITILGRA